MSDAQQPESTTGPIPPIPPAPAAPDAAPANPYVQQPANPYTQQPANPYAQQAPNPYAAAPVGYAPAPAGPSRLNVPGLVSLILGGLAFLLGVTFGWIPFVGFLPIVLALVGVVLGIIGLVVKNKGKGLAIAGTIVSGVALLVAALITIVMIGVFTSLQTLADDVDDYGVDEPSITEPDGSDVDGGVGSMEQPAAIGDTITFTDYADADEWQVVVGDPALDATADVLAADEFNMDPAAGSQYVVVPLVYSYLGAETGFPFIGASPEFVGTDGAVYSVTYATYPDSLYDAPELTTGAQASVNAVFEVPSSAVAGGLLKLTSIYGTSIYVAVA
jgi:hypothetical protein